MFTIHFYEVASGYDIATSPWNKITIKKNGKPSISIRAIVITMANC